MGRKGPCSISKLLWCATGVLLLIAVQGVYSEHEPTESECRPYIERALKDHHVETDEASVESHSSSIEQEENYPIDESASGRERRDTGEVTESTTEDSSESQNQQDESNVDTNEDNGESRENPDVEEEIKTEQQNDLTSSDDNDSNEGSTTEDQNKTQEDSQEGSQGSQEDKTTEEVTSQEGDTAEVNADEKGQVEEGDATESSQEDGSAEKNDSPEGDTAEEAEDSHEVDKSEEAQGSQEGDASEEAQGSQERDLAEGAAASQEGDTAEEAENSQEGDTAEEPQGSQEGDAEETRGSQEGDATEETQSSQEGDTAEETQGSQEGDTAEEAQGSQEENKAEDTQSSQEGDSAEATEGSQEGDVAEEGASATEEDSTEGENDSNADTKVETDGSSEESKKTAESGEGETTETIEDAAVTSGEAKDDSTSQEGSTTESASQETIEEAASKEAGEKIEESGSTSGEKDSSASQETAEDSKDESAATEEVSTEETQQQEEPVEELTHEAIVPANLRPRGHITQILKLDEDSQINEIALGKTIDNTLNTLKKLYDSAIKPLEILYKYRDLSNRHFGDPEIFSKPLILFMGPWSGGKSSTINYLLDLEFTELALRTGAEPSPAYFNILTYGEETEILDGTQLAADWTFSGLQKFGQGLLDRLRGVKLKNRLLEKVNIVEIPGILEIRKQVQRLFPFNDACQWFIDRADIIFLVYDPAKLDVGPETEAILDQLKGREYQTRIVLNKADQVKPEELMRVQGTLIWNISPLMSSQEPPVMYTTSLWSLPYETHAPTRLLHAQERAFLRDLREAIDKRVENKIASARRFAVRVRNHAKMVDCYLTTYYNHKTFFGNKKKVADDIIETPSKYHIYEGLSTLTNISRYDLPDPEMYRDFFRINNLYDFTKLSDTCTYFRGCPINKLDIAIAYELPDLVGKYKKAIEQAKPKS